MIKAQLIDLGRNNVNKVVEVKNTQALHKEIGRYILAKDWGMEQTDDESLYTVTSGWGVVGKVKILNQHNESQDNRSHANRGH